MKVGVPKEVKNHEYRVAITPIGVHELTSHGHEVYIQSGAGAGSSVPDEEYSAAGAQLLHRWEGPKPWFGGSCGRRSGRDAPVSRSATNYCPSPPASPAAVT